MADKLRRREARDKDGHRCRKHLWHLLEVPTERGVELPADEGDKHRAFGKEWAD
jgi:hypothetical protein